MGHRYIITSNGYSGFQQRFVTMADSLHSNHIGLCSLSKISLIHSLSDHSITNTYCQPNILIKKQTKIPNY